MHLNEIKLYLSQYYAGTPKRFFSALKKSVDNLKENPYIAQVYLHDSKYRRLVVGDYLVFYTVDEDKAKVEVHRILHSSRDTERHI